MLACTIFIPSARMRTDRSSKLPPEFPLPVKSPLRGQFSPVQRAEACIAIEAPLPYPEFESRRMMFISLVSYSIRSLEASYETSRDEPAQPVPNRAARRSERKSGERIPLRIESAEGIVDPRPLTTPHSSRRAVTGSVRAARRSWTSAAARTLAWEGRCR